MGAQKKSAPKKTPAKKPAAKKATKMPAWSKSPPELVAAFAKALGGRPEAQTRLVFGYPAAFVNGHMFAGLHQDSFILRLPESERKALLQSKGAHIFEPMPGRPMHEYVVVPPLVLESAGELDRWLGKALAYAHSLPPKARKAKRK